MPGPRAMAGVGVAAVMGVGFIAVANSNILINFVGKHGLACGMASEWVQVQIRWQLDSRHKFWVLSAFVRDPISDPAHFVLLHSK